MTKKKGILFLFGAGASVHAGGPKTQTITEHVLSGKDIHHSNSGYSVTEKCTCGPLCDKYGHVRLARGLLTDLHCKVKMQFPQGAFKPSYEELLAYALQLAEYEQEATIHPLIAEFAKRIRENFPVICGRDNINRQWGEVKWWVECEEYISCILTHYLNRVDQNLYRNSMLLDAIKYSRQSRIGLNILTTNQDTLLEGLLESEQIPFVDGFDTEASTTLTIWNPVAFKGHQIKLLKLHGSVSWRNIFCFKCRHRVVFKAPIDESTAICSECSEKMIVDWINWYLLAGKETKEQAYLSPPFFDLINQLYNSLKQTNCIIVVGHSLQDNGINTMLTGWAMMDPASKIVIVNPDEQISKRVTRRIMRTSSSPNPRVIPIHGSLENTSWEEVKAAIG